MLILGGFKLTYVDTATVIIIVSNVSCCAQEKKRKL